MRPIEYRAWYHKEQKMFEVTNLRWRYPIVYEDLELESFELIDRDSKNCHRVHIQDRNVELMQYTGLQDKHGVKIFKDDIILWYSQRYPISFDEGAWVLQGSDQLNDDLVTLWNVNQFSEVIGNIWEHLQRTEKPDSAS